MSEEQQAGAGAVQFRSRRPKGNFRTKRETSAEPEQQEQQQGQQEGGKDPSDVQRDKLEETKLLHKLRKRHGGTSSSALAQAGAEAELVGSLGGGHDHDAHGGVMEGFSKAKQQAQDNTEDKNMQAFVEAELARRLGKRVDDADAEDPEARRLRLEAEMYKIPDEYKTTLVGDTVVPGMTGLITEVAISSSARLRNIEAVEEMKKRMLSGGQDEAARRGGAGKGGLKRKEFVMEFGRQQKKKDLSREELEEHARRMKYVSERKPAVPLHRLNK